MKWTGTYTALVTPFSDSRVDEAALEKLIQIQIENGVDGIVPVGTTGESPTLNIDEHIRVIEFAVKAAAGKVKVIAGTGANATDEAVHLTREAEKVGADASLQVTPYYNKPTQNGLFEHFGKIAEHTNLPLILYSIPGRSVIEIAADTVQRLAEKFDNIVGLKEAGGSTERVSYLRNSLPADFSILSGDDSQTMPFMALGGDGVISVASNLIPAEMSNMVSAMTAGNLAEGRRLHLKYFPLFKALFIETNPVPVKAALAMKGLIREEYRLPLIPMAPKNRERLETVLKNLELI
ncbi:MAG: 4-hydroxy-tetrahydrodipicolinate synthase [Verrucomicrobia bacterium]|nr:4-hydroxy-tetrahydrodipicolinate synthase [Verrucomicrobiota bacterium]MCF7708629.1 4-hydroxy-tetrahydrodipicolinate synthase [Verrucomicrobiota bacterium]